MDKNDIQNDMLSDTGASFERGGFSLYQKRRKNNVRNAVVGAVALGCIGFYAAGDKITALTADNSASSAGVASLNKVTDEATDGSFTDISPAAGEQTAINQAQKIAESQNGTDATAPAEVQANENTATEKAEETAVEKTSPEKTDKKDLVAKILQESAQNVKKKTTLDTKTITGGAPNPELEEIITGKKNDNPIPGARAAMDKTQSTAEIIRDSVVVKPAIKKIVIVEKNFASSSDRALAQAALRAVEGKQYAAAYDLYSEILKKDPRNPIALSGKAKTLVYMNRKEEAEAVYHEIMNRNPSDSEAMSNYFSLIGEKDPATAAAELEQLAQNNPKSAEIQGQLGIVYGKMKDPIRATKAFEKAAILDPSNPVYLFNTAVLSDRMANKTKAIEYYERTLSLLKSSAGKSSLSEDMIENRLSELYRQ